MTMGHAILNESLFLLPPLYVGSLESVHGLIIHSLILLTL